MVIDASIWVAAFLKKDAHHLESVHFLQRLVATAVTVELPNLALAEIGGAVARQTQDSVLARAIATNSEGN
jgi:predicted nucleic acid-binding protein